MPINALQEEGFIGRAAALQDLHRWALDAARGSGQSIVLSGAPGSGKTELLKQFFTHLFWKQDAIAPFYYSVSSAILSAPLFARDYLTRFLCQRLAFENKEESLLFIEGVPVRELAAWTRERGAAWAGEMLDRFQRCADDPIDMLRVALHAPLQAALFTGKPAVVLLDDFHKLARLHHQGAADPSLIALFDPVFSGRKSPHLITGSAAELQALSMPGVTWLPLRPLTTADAERLFSAVLQARGIAADKVPPALLDVLGGNPLYLRCVAGAVRPGKIPGEAEFWSAFDQEVTAGGIYHYYATALKTLFAGSEVRREALEALYGIYEAEGAPAEERRPKGPDAAKLSAPLASALLSSGFLRGEFGGYRAPDDRVMRQFISRLYEREVGAKPPRDIRHQAPEQRLSPQVSGNVFELALPLAPQAELVVARSLEQIGRNLQLPEDVIGQMQMAVIEACINAIEHNRGGERRLFVTISAEADRLEVSVESPGRDFTQAETGEPFIGTALREGGPRGQGVKLMKRFTDSMRYEKTGRGTRVVLGKRLTRSPAPGTEGAPDHE
jgi:anti-sigma regulatory factor (Ser/Thr protein kinase)